MFIGGFHPSTTYSELHWALEQIGPVESLSLRKDYETGEPKGYAFFTINGQKVLDLFLEADVFLHGRIL